jgi:hypothetical protein
MKGQLHDLTPLPTGKELVVPRGLEAVWISCQAQRSGIEPLLLGSRAGSLVAKPTLSCRVPTALASCSGVQSLRPALSRPVTWLRKENQFPKRSCLKNSDNGQCPECHLEVWHRSPSECSSAQLKNSLWFRPVAPKDSHTAPSGSVVYLEKH